MTWSPVWFPSNRPSMVRAYGALTIRSGMPAMGCTRSKPTSIHAVYSTAILAPS